MESIAFIENYFDQMRCIQETLLIFLENDDTSKEGEEFNFNTLVEQLNEQGIDNNKNRLKLILNLISKISDNHHRNPLFFDRIERIFNTLKKQIIKNYSNYDIFKIYKKNKRILLFLFEEKIITPDKSISTIISNDQYKQMSYPQYFFKEFETVFDEKFLQDIKSKYPEINSNLYNEKRKNGENDSFICNLIQNDSIDEFVTYVNKTNFSLSKSIDQSIYETNIFLLKNRPSLIEYAVFYGSFQIFKYLQLNNVDINPSIWLYAIHGSNPEIIHILEENGIQPLKNSLQTNYFESIKCHHINLANYFENNIDKDESETKKLIFSKSLQNYNFASFCNNDIKNEDLFYVFFDFCKYDYIDIVDYLLKNTEMKIQSRKI